MKRFGVGMAAVAILAGINGMLFATADAGGVFDGVVATQNGQPLTVGVVVAISALSGIAAVVGRLLLATWFGPRRGRRVFLWLVGLVLVSSLPSPFVGLEGGGLSARLVLEVLHVITAVGGVVAAEIASRPTWAWGREEYRTHALHGPVVVTGATGGIGRATALELARRGIDVVGVGRSETKASEVEQAAADLPGTVHVHVVDLGSMAAAADFGHSVASRHPDGIAGVVHAVGTLKPSSAMTTEGLDANIATSWLSRVAVTRALPPLLPGGRHVTIAAAESGSLPRGVDAVPADPDDLGTGMAAHGTAQLANDVWAASLSRSGIAAFGYGPGAVDTDIRRELPSPIRRLMAPLFWWETRLPEDAARDVVRLLLDADLGDGGFASRDGLFEHDPLVTDPENHERITGLADQLLARARLAIS